MHFIGLSLALAAAVVVDARNVHLPHRFGRHAGLLPRNVNGTNPAYGSGVATGTNGPTAIPTSVAPSTTLRTGSEPLSTVTSFSTRTVSNRVTVSAVTNTVIAAGVSPIVTTSAGSVVTVIPSAVGGTNTLIIGTGVQTGDCLAVTVTTTEKETVYVTVQPSGATDVTSVTDAATGAPAAPTQHTSSGSDSDSDSETECPNDSDDEPEQTSTGSQLPPSPSKSLTIPYGNGTISTNPTVGPTGIPSGTGLTSLTLPLPTGTAASGTISAQAQQTVTVIPVPI